MRNRGGKRGAPIGVARSRNPISLREESTGKRQIKDRGGSNNAKSFLKLEHLQKLAVWASGEASIPSLGAFFGYRLAATAESLGVSPDSSLFPCQRCETILQPGFNCTNRIETNKSKAQRGQIKHKDLVQNNVVYTCHFCSHRNMKKWTPRAHRKAMIPKERTPSESKPNFTQKSQSKEILIEGGEKSGKESDLNSNTTMEEVLIADSPITPVIKAMNPAKDRTPSESNPNFTQKSQSKVILIEGGEKSGKESDLTSNTTMEEVLIADSPRTPVIKVMNPAKDRTPSESKPNFTQKSQSKEILIEGGEKSGKESDLTSNTTMEEVLIADSPTTPVIKIGTSLLDGKKKRNRSTAKKQHDLKSISTQTDRNDVDCSAVKRQRKSWTSLKEIAQAETRSKLCKALQDSALGIDNVEKQSISIELKNIT